MLQVYRLVTGPVVLNHLTAIKKKKKKDTTVFVVSGSYLNKDQQRIQENNARTRRMSLHRSYLTAFPKWQVPKLQEITS